MYGEGSAVMYGEGSAVMYGKGSAIMNHMNPSSCLANVLHQLLPLFTVPSGAEW